ncbi:MAG: Asp-tRNA(Asn)/Glu-tRNA(Gln) amidotransferase subunit GatC [Candidatus Micrarchaeia archaeon]
MEYIDFDRLLKICRLELEPDEKEKMQKGIVEVIAYFDTLNSFNAEVEGTASKEEKPGVLREDVVKEFDDVDGLLKNTKTYRFYVVGPKI